MYIDIITTTREVAQWLSSDVVKSGDVESILQKGKSDENTAITIADDLKTSGRIKYQGVLCIL